MNMEIVKKDYVMNPHTKIILNKNLGTLIICAAIFVLCFVGTASAKPWYVGDGYDSCDKKYCKYGKGQSSFEHHAFVQHHELQNRPYEHIERSEDMDNLMKYRMKPFPERTNKMRSSEYYISQIQENGINITGNYSTLWHESLVANYTRAGIGPDIDGDGNYDVLARSRRYNPTTNVQTAKVMAMKGCDGSHLWEESVSASGEGNCNIYGSWTYDLDGDGLGDAIIRERKYDSATDTETAKVIAKKGIDGTLLWEESVSVSGKYGCDIWAFTTAGGEDMEGDGLADVIVAIEKYDSVTDTETAKVIIMKGCEGTHLWEESVSASGKGNCDISGNWAYDLDGDGLADVIIRKQKYDLVTDTETAKVIAKKGIDGTLLWEKSVSASGSDGCGIRTYSIYSDLDGDDLGDTIICERKYDSATDTETAKVIAKKGIDGTLLWEESVSASGEYECDISASTSGRYKDMEGDGLTDVIVEIEKYDSVTDTETAKVIAMKGLDGTHLWEESVSASGEGNCDISGNWAYNLDGDDLGDVIIRERKYDSATDTETAKVIAMKGLDGTHLWEESVSACGDDDCDIRGYSACSDLDGDGLYDVTLTKHEYKKATDTTTDKVVIMKGCEGKHLWEESVSARRRYCNIWVFNTNDLDGDGLDDVIVKKSNYDESTFKWAETTTAKRGIDGTTLLEAQSNESIWVARWQEYDLNGDGKNDLLFGTSTEMYAITYIYGTNIFDTEKPANPYPCINGIHKGTINLSDNITVSKLYTYPCAGTGGHTESIGLYENETLIANGTWNGYGGDWHNITITPSVILKRGHTYNYTIVTGSYPQILVAKSKNVTGGTITCTSFVDTNGKAYTDRIPAIKFF